MTSTILEIPLDHTAAIVRDRVGVVCLAAGMVRCWRCSALMREVVINGEVGYRCSDSHLLPQASVDEALWECYLRQAGAPILNAIVDPVQRRRCIHSAFSAIVLDPEQGTRYHRRLIIAVYPRLNF